MVNIRTQALTKSLLSYQNSSDGESIGYYGSRQFISPYPGNLLRWNIWTYDLEGCLATIPRQHGGGFFQFPVPREEKISGKRDTWYYKYPNTRVSFNVQRSFRQITFRTCTEGLRSETETERGWRSHLSHGRNQKNTNGLASYQAAHQSDSNWISKHKETEILRHTDL